MSQKIKHELIESCRSLDRAAQKELYHALIPYLAAVAKRYLKQSSEINDVLQESFIKIFTHLEQFDERKGSFEAWSSRILIHCCFKNNDKFSRTANNVVELQESSQQVDPTVWDHLSCEEIFLLLKKIPLQHSEVFQLKVIDGFDHAEIATLLGINEALSRKRLSRAKGALAKIIERRESNWKKSMG